jgi:hypothetical protein
MNGENMEIVYGILTGVIFALAVPFLLFGGAVVMSHLCARYPIFDRWFGGY